MDIWRQPYNEGMLRIPSFPEALFVYAKYTNRVGESLLDYYRKMIADKRLTPLPSENADNPCRSSSDLPR